MVLEFLSNPSTTDILMFLVLFLLFVMSIKKMMNLLTNIILVSVAAVLIPVLASRLIGLPIPTDSGSLITYAGMGILAYFIYMAGKYVMRGARTAGKVGSKLLPKRSGKKVVIEKRIVEERVPAQRRAAPKRDRKSEAETFKDYVILDEKPRAAQKEQKPSSQNVEDLPEIKFEKRSKKLKK